MITSDDGSVLTEWTVVWDTYYSGFRAVWSGEHPTYRACTRPYVSIAAVQRAINNGDLWEYSDQERSQWREVQ